jgi:hypothetical protein
MATMVGANPAVLYRTRGGDYRSDANGVIVNVPNNDVVDLINSGLTMAPTGVTGPTGPMGATGATGPAA